MCEQDILGGEMDEEKKLRVRFFGQIRIRIFDPRWCIKGTDESLPRVDSLVPLIHHDTSDLGSKIRIRIFPKKRTLGNNFEVKFYYQVDESMMKKTHLPKISFSLRIANFLGDS